MFLETSFYRAWIEMQKKIVKQKFRTKEIIKIFNYEHWNQRNLICFCSTTLSVFFSLPGHIFRAAGDQPFNLSTVSSAFPMVSHPVFGLHSASSGHSEFGGLGTLGTPTALAAHPQLASFPGKHLLQNSVQKRKKAWKYSSSNLFITLNKREQYNASYVKVLCKNWLKLVYHMQKKIRHTMC